MGEKNHLRVIEEALAAGVGAVALRVKELHGREVLELARALRSLTDSFGAKLIVNDRVDVALLVGADGVHLPQNGFSPAQVRPIIGERMLVGVSTHTLTEALRAEAEGADFVTFGPVFHTPSKARYGGPVGVGSLREATEKLDIPVFALGGIKKENAAQVMQSGAYGVSVISWILGADDVRKNTVALLKEMDAGSSMDTH